MLLIVLSALLTVGLLVYCLVDCAQTPAHTVRAAPRAAWLAAIALLPLVGPVGWLLAGRPHRARHQRPAWPHLPDHDGGPSGPEDDPQFLEQLARRDPRREG